MAHTDFDGWGFALGHVSGARSWALEQTGNGTLTGVFHKRAWQSGENVAECRQVVGHIIPDVGVTDETHPVWEIQPDGRNKCIGWTWTIDGVEGIKLGNLPERLYRGEVDVNDHDARDCRHGFYAYQQGTLDWGQALNISGVVHGYGKVSLGERGFRAEKAKIAALYHPPRDLFGAYSLEERIAVITDLPVREAFLRAGSRSLVSDDLFERVAWRYPDVPIFSDIDEMLAAFPVDPPREIKE